MTMPINLHPQYITDDNGDKVSVVIDMQEFESMLEDIEVLTTIADRKDEETTSHDDFLKELRADGTL
jgi:PHD/YefM family antitoxin component YafN of YafNO toxin-antitoxin module